MLVALQMGKRRYDPTQQPMSKEMGITLSDYYPVCMRKGKAIGFVCLLHVA